MTEDVVHALREVVAVIRHDHTHPDHYDPAQEWRARWEAARAVLGTCACATAATAVRIALDIPL